MTFWRVPVFLSLIATPRTIGKGGNFGFKVMNFNKSAVVVFSLVLRITQFLLCPRSPRKIKVRDELISLFLREILNVIQGSI